MEYGFGLTLSLPMFLGMKLPSAYYVFCTFSNVLQNTITMTANTRNPDQTGSSLVLVHIVCNIGSPSTKA